MDEIIQNGFFRIPLYHGTASQFSESIERFGLGSVNPIAQYDVKEFLNRALMACDQAFANDTEWMTSRFATEWMVHQESFSDSGNFQHGDSYLTPSRASAVSYALTNRFGSELITQAWRLWRLLAERRPEVSNTFRLEEHPLVSLFQVEPRPLLVIASGVSVAGVLSEGGNRPIKPSNNCDFLVQCLMKTVF